MGVRERGTEGGIYVAPKIHRIATNAHLRMNINRTKPHKTIGQGKQLHPTPQVTRRRMSVGGGGGGERRRQSGENEGEKDDETAQHQGRQEGRGFSDVIDR